MYNEDVALFGKRVVLVPYLSQFVPRYHQWMCSPELLQLTCSEPLSLEEEYENQISWLQSTDKLTFIILAPITAVLTKTATMAAAVEVHDVASRSQHDIPDEPGRDGAVSDLSLEVDEEVKDALVRTYVMIGDCNLFVPPNFEEDGVEIEVMIAEHHFRRLGFAKETLRLLMSYAMRELRHTTFVAKILAENEASKKLFVEGLGFKFFKEVRVFGEEHFMSQLHPEAFKEWEANGFPYVKKSFKESVEGTEENAKMGLTILQDVPGSLL